MNILILSHEFPPIGGGGANACLNLAKKFTERGHTVTVITVKFGAESEMNNRLEGVRFVWVSSRRKYKDHSSFSEMLDYLLKARSAADRLLKKEKFDICLTFFAIPSGPLALYLKKKYGLPYVIRFGGGDIPGAQKRFKYVYKLIAPAERMVWKEASALVANSSGLRERALPFYDKKEIEIICNGVDIDTFQDFNRSKSPERFKILFVSRIIERKGLQFIIPQIREAWTQCGRQLELVVVGDGPYRSALEALVKKLDVGDIVTFAGWIEKKEMPSYYADASVFILPSLSEGMPNVVLEAMSSGLPIIMTPCEGSTELIDGNGYIAEHEQFGKHIVELYQNSEKRAAFGVESRKRVLDLFLWKTIADQYLQLFSKVLNKGKR